MGKQDNSKKSGKQGKLQCKIQNPLSPFERGRRRYQFSPESSSGLNSQFSIIKIKPVLFLSFILWFSILAGCARFDDFSTNPNHRLLFSLDTLAFDTIFSTIGSTTKQFLVYNPNNEALKIESIVLASGGASGFRFNVDGRKGDSFQGIDIWKKDSLFISVEVTVNPNGANQPIVIEDSILFLTNGIKQSVLLQAYGQDIHLLKGGVIFLNDTTLSADLPFLIYDSLIVAEGATLTITQGATFYMHNHSRLIISGTVKAKGTPDNPIVFRGDRLDYIPLPDMRLLYDVIPGQWGGIYFNTTSFENEIDYMIVRNGLTGLTFRESSPDRIKLQINNSQITNMDSTTFVASNCFITAVNSEFSNATYSNVFLAGGRYQFTHCTLANYKLLGNARYPGYTCLALANQIDNNHTSSFTLHQAFFDNCIIDGGHSADSTQLYGGEIFFNTSEQDKQGNPETFNYRFTSCMIKTAHVDSERFNHCLFITSPSYLKNGLKEDNYAFDFRLANESAGIGMADRTISAQYPVDRYGVNRLTSPDGPTIGAYEYVYQEDI